MMEGQKRLLLWVAYAFCGVGLYFVFGGWGHASFAPMAIFFSWGYLLVTQVGPLLEIGDLALIVASLLTLIAYLIVLCIGSRRLVAWRGRPWYFVAAGVHGIGAAVAQSIKGNGHLATQGWVMQSYIWSIAALLLFFLSDYWLLERRIAAKAGYEA